MTLPKYRSPGGPLQMPSGQDVLSAVKAQIADENTRAITNDRAARAEYDTSIGSSYRHYLGSLQDWGG